MIVEGEFGLTGRAGVGQGIRHPSESRHGLKLQTLTVAWSRYGGIFADLGRSGVTELLVLHYFAAASPICSVRPAD